MSNGDDVWGLFRAWLVSSSREVGDDDRERKGSFMRGFDCELVIEAAEDVGPFWPDNRADLSPDRLIKRLND